MRKYREGFPLPKNELPRPFIRRPDVLHHLDEYRPGELEAEDDYLPDANYDSAEREAYHRWVEAGKPATGIKVIEVVDERLADIQRAKQRPFTPSPSVIFAQRRINRRKKSSGH